MINDPVVTTFTALPANYGTDGPAKPFPKPNDEYVRSPLLDDPNYEIVSDPFVFRTGHYIPVYVQGEDAADFVGLDLDGDVVKAYPKPGSPLNPLIVGAVQSAESLAKMFKALDHRVVDSVKTDYTQKPAVHPLMSKLLARAK